MLNIYSMEARFICLLYRRPGFNCECLINANFDFSLRARLLDCNYYCSIINSVHVTHLLTLNLQVRSKMNILRYLKPVTGNTFQLLMKEDCRPASPRK